MREIVVGTLGVLRHPKYGSASLIERILISKLADDGKLPSKFYYPPMFWLVNDRQANGHEYMYKFKGRPKALLDAKAGDIVTVKATLQEWQNGLGCYLMRPEILGIQGVIDVELDGTPTCP